MQYETVTEKVIEAIELRRAGLNIEQQQPITVHYHGEVVGESVADLIVDGVIIVELKSVRRIIKAHEIQLVNYLVPTGMDFGAEKEVGVKGKVAEVVD